MQTFLPTLNFLNASYNFITSLENDFHGLPVLCTADLSNNMINLISPDVVAHTRCTTHGVQSKLDIFLRGNFIYDDKNI